MRLKSDFRDWYDHAFDRDGPEFVRLSRGGLSRREMFVFLDDLDLRVPLHGTVSTIVPRLERGEGHLLVGHGWRKLVVYQDEHAHCGEGKVLMDAQDALDSSPEAYCSEYIPVTPSCVGISIRHLQVGQQLDSKVLVQIGLAL